MNFEEMQTATGDESDYDYDFDNFETVEWPADDEAKTVLGELLAIREEVGKYDSTVYLLEDDGEKLMVWGNASIDAAVQTARDEGGLEEGDVLGIRQTGETYENEYGEFAQYEVRFQKAD